MKRKNRVVVEITTDIPITAKRAKDIIQEFVTRVSPNVEQEARYRRFPYPSVENLNFKEFDRVLNAEKQRCQATI